TTDDIPVAKAIQPSSKSNRRPTTMIRPASFSNITSEGAPPRAVQMADLNPAHFGATRENPQPMTPVIEDLTVVPITLVKNEPHLRTSDPNLRPKIPAPRELDSIPIAVVKNSPSRREIIKTEAYKPSPMPPVKTVSIPFAKNSSTVFYTVQVGAYENKTFAQTMIQKLSGKGYNAFLTQIKKGRGLLYKVHMEKFSDKKKADQYARHFFLEEKMDNFVTKVEMS
ncbi:MAG: SPOR domain-containing protein, partial [Nitrospinota bacterium]|nr:SPOR domain-containing protein [Nitrospinota bacterium]